MWLVLLNTLAPLTTRVRGLLSNPKIRPLLISGASYYAGVYGGPLASEWVRDHAPQIINVLVTILGG